MNHTQPTCPALPADASWFKSSFSGQDSSVCVEVALTPGVVGLRDTKDRARAAHTYTPQAWNALLESISGGEFDLPQGAA